MANEKAKVLVVDDDPSILKVTRSILEHEGYEVEVAQDGQEAIELIAAKPFDLLLLDIKMPRLNGWEVCAIVRRQSHTRELPILFLTGRVEVRDQITAMQVGGSDHLKKPFDGEELRNKVRALTRRGPSGAAA